LLNCCVFIRYKNKIMKEIKCVMLEKNGGFAGLSYLEKSAGFKKENNVKIIMFKLMSEKHC